MDFEEMDGIRVLEPDILDVLSEIDSTEKKESGMRELISLLKSAFRPSDFKKIQEILRLREKKFEIEKEAVKLEIEKDYKELIKKDIAKVGLEKELEVYRNRCIELEKKNAKAELDVRVLATELETKEKEATQRYTDLEIKFKELKFSTFVMEGEIKKNKSTFFNLENQIMCLEEDHRVACEREQSAKEKLADLLKEMEKNEREAREKYLQIKMENQELECRKRRAEREIENYKRRYGELDSRVLGSKEDNSVLDGREHGKIEVAGFKVSFNEASCEENGRGHKSGDAQIQFEGKMPNYRITSYPPSDVGSITHSPVRGSEVLQVAGLPLFSVLSKSVTNDKIVDSIDAKEGSSHRVKKQLSFEPEGSSDRKVASATPGSVKSILGGVIEISDSEDEMNMTPASTSNFMHDGTVRVLMKPALGKTSGDAMLMASQNGSNEDAGEENGSSCEENFMSILTPKRKRTSKVIASESEDDDNDGIPLSQLKMKIRKDSTTGIKQSSDSPTDQFHSIKEPVSADEENGSSCKENFLSILTPKRKRASKVIASESEDDENDRIPISKLKTKKLTDLTVGIKQSSDSPTDQFHIIKEPVTPSRRRLVSLRQCEESKGEKRTSPSQLCAQNLLPDDENVISGANANEVEVEDVGSDSEDESLGGFIVNEESLTPSRRRLGSLQQSEETKVEKKTSPRRLRSQNLLPDDKNMMSGTNAKEDKVEDVGSDSSEGESLGGFIVNESDDSVSNGPEDSVSEHGSDASEDLADPDSALDEVIARIRRSKDSTRWEYEADMLSSFSKDPELCMKAVCALYRQQTSEEKSTKESIYANRRGFSKFDALRASTLAEFLTEGDPRGPPKKSVKELEKHDPRAPDYCLKLASHYSKQLFEIYQNKEDPLFLPS